MAYWFGWTDALPQSLEHAFQAARKALTLDDSYADAHWVMATLYQTKRQYEQAVPEFERGLALNPNNADIRV